MEEMIARIVEMDKKAREMTDEAVKNKLDYEQRIIQTKEKIKNDYLERAKQRIEVNRQSAQKKADDQLRLIMKKNSAVVQRLEESCAQNSERWADEIFARVVGADA